ncbi:MAG: hypothetical protein JW884_03955 [Deltaproteobacteria bacterium]|nr:hypothetical protein [Deltaproteobacteria bacterium]
MEKILDNIAEKVLTLDEASLSQLWEKYKNRMEHFDGSKEWEKSIIAFFIINAIRVKNQIFNDQILKNPQFKPKETKKPSPDVPYLKRIK